jgi:hypothetical protein
MGTRLRSANLRRCSNGCVRNDATAPADEKRLAGAISFLYVVAVRAFLRGVRRINVDHRHPGTVCLVRDEGTELSERPGTHHDPLGLTVPYPCADAREVFQGDAAPGAFSLGHDVLRNAVIDIPAAALFFAPLPFQYPFRRPGLLRLELPAQRTLAAPVPVDAPACHPLTVAGGGDADDAQVGAQPSCGVIVQRGSGNIHGDKLLCSAR